jgi:hypothetical protein
MTQRDGRSFKTKRTLIRHRVLHFLSVPGLLKIKRLIYFCIHFSFEAVVCANEATTHSGLTRPGREKPETAMNSLLKHFSSHRGIF